MPPKGKRYDIIAPTISQKAFIANARADAISHDAVLDANGQPIYVVGLEVVTWRSPAVFRNALEKIAYFFKREEGYDFTPYEASDRDHLAVSFIWTDDKHDVDHVGIGGCSFRWRTDWKDLPACWCMSWCWLHPYERRHGRLTEAWPYFEARFGRFFVEPPWSAAMQSFLMRRRHWTIVEAWPQDDSKGLPVVRNAPNR